MEELDGLLRLVSASSRVMNFMASQRDYGGSIRSNSRMTIVGRVAEGHCRADARAALTGRQTPEVSPLIQRLVDSPKGANSAASSRCWRALSRRLRLRIASLSFLASAHRRHFDMRSKPAMCFE